MPKTFFIVVLVIFLACGREELAPIRSNFNVATTVARIDSLIKNHPPLEIVTVIDYEKKANSVGMQIRPTQVVIFGDPSFYTQLVTCKQILAIHLPQKMLVWRDDTFQVWIGYETPPKGPDFHHGVECSRVTGEMEKTARSIAEKAAGLETD
jgi:uncharacterized protein (DUF302 family)